MTLDEILAPRSHTAGLQPAAELRHDQDERPKLIKASMELRRRAVNRRQGLEMVLTQDVRSRMQTVIAKAITGFETETLARLAELRRLVTGLGHDEFALVFLIPQLQDLAFDIKGMAGTFGYDLLTDLAKSLQDFLASMEMPTSTEFEVVAIHIDALYLLLSSRVNGQGGDMERELLITLGYASDKVLTHIKTMN